MELDELIRIINGGMKEKDSWIDEKHSWLKQIIKSPKEPFMYLHEFLDSENPEYAKCRLEYDFFHTLAKYGIFQEDPGINRKYNLFRITPEGINALKNPKVYFDSLKEGKING